MTRRNYLQKIIIQGKGRVWYVDVVFQGDKQEQLRHHSNERSMAHALVKAFQKAYIRPLKWRYQNGRDQCFDGKSCIGEVINNGPKDFEWWVDGAYEGSAQTRENAMIAVELLHRARLPEGLDYARNGD